MDLASCKPVYPSEHTRSTLAFGQIQFRLFAFMIAGFLLTYVAQ